MKRLPPTAAGVEPTKRSRLVGQHGWLDCDLIYQQVKQSQKGNKRREGNTIAQDHCQGWEMLLAIVMMMNVIGQKY